MSTILKNKIFMLVSNSLRMAAALCATGPLMQTFLKVMGFSSEFVYIHSTFTQASMVLTMMLSAQWADKGSIIKRTAIAQIPNGILFLMYLPICISRSASIQMYILLLVIGGVQSIMSGLLSVCEYKLPYFVYRSKDYAMISGISGILSSCINFGIGALISALSLKCDYVNIMFVSFIVSAACMILSAILTAALKIISNVDIKKNEKINGKIPLLVVFRHVIFRGLLLPNFLRGVFSGIISILAVVAFDLGFDETVTTIMVSIQSIAGFAGCIWFTFASKWISSRMWVFAGSMILILIPFLAFVDNSIVFLGIYFIIVFGRTLVDYAIPVALFHIVPVEIAGVYHAWRIILHNGGMLVATMIATVLPTNVLLILAGACAIYSGASYFWFSELRSRMPLFIGRVEGR